MERLGIAPSKKLGQNFLVDEQFLDWLAKYSGLKEKEPVIEIGPGFGALTVRMLAAGVRLTAIEFDRKLAGYLREELVPKGLTLIEGDACKTDYESIYGPDVDFRVISNLPYSAGTVIVAKLLDLPLPPREMIVMLQKEVAFRFAAHPGEDEYSALTARIANLYHTTIVKVIPPDLFYPRPEIDSCIIRMTRKEDYPSFALRKILSRLVRVSFAHRRKKMFRQAASVFGDELVELAMNTAGVDLDIRAERVTPEQFAVMAQVLIDKGVQ